MYTAVIPNDRVNISLEPRTQIGQSLRKRLCCEALAVNPQEVALPYWEVYECSKRRQFSKLRAGN